MANTDTTPRRGQLAANCTEAASNGCQILGDLMYNLSDVCLGGERRRNAGGILGAFGKSVSDALEASAKTVRKATTNDGLKAEDPMTNP
jgi:hypothetical protein